MVKVLLAVFVGLFRRNVTPLEDQLTPLVVSIVAALASVLLLLVVFELIRSRRLRERYALLWLLTAVVMLVFSLWRAGLGRVAGAVGVAYPPTVLLAIGSLFILARAAALLDRDLAPLRPEHDPRPAARPAGAAPPRAARLAKTAEPAASTAPTAASAPYALESWTRLDRRVEVI